MAYNIHYIRIYYTYNIFKESKKMNFIEIKIILRYLNKRYSKK